MRLFSTIYRTGDGKPLFAPEVEPTLFLIAWGVAAAVGVIAAVDPGAARGASRSGGRDPEWLSAVAPMLRLAGVRKSYNIGTPVEAEVLHGIDLTLEPGEFAALVGPSGSGKSTLLNIVGLLERPTGGQVLIAGRDTGTLDEARSPSCAGAPSASCSSSTICCRPSPRSRT